MTEQLQSVTNLKTRPPAVPANVITRPVLARRLTAGASLPMTLVSAGPGTGKTLTVASWHAAHMSRLAVGWLSLDGSDNDIRVFWSELIVALVASGGVPADSPLRDITPAAEFGAAEVAEVQARLSALASPIVLVLDDFHEITDELVLETFRGLVDHLPPTLRLVVLSRTDPPLRLHRLRVDGRLAEIRGADLAFTEQETAQLFHVAGIDLNAQQVIMLLQRTEGWAAGLRLAAITLNLGDIDDGINRFSGIEHPVAEYLAGEVMAGLPPGDREFVLRTSVVERLSGPLATRLTGRPDAQHMLERLVRANAFVVELGGRNEWFSYHRMMREMLLHRLALDRPEVKVELHRLAAQWMLEHEQPIEAIRQSILGDDIDRAGRILLSVMPRIVTPDGPALAAAVEPLARRAPDNPSLTTLLAAATCHFHRHQYVAMLQDVTEAGDYLEDVSDREQASAEVVISLFRMVAARTQGDPVEVVRLASLALAVLDGPRRAQIPAGRGLRLIAESNRAGAQVWTGGAGVEERLIHVVDQAQELGLPLPHLNANGHLALLDALHGRCRSAGRRSRDALELIDRHGWGSEPQSLATFLSRALVELARHRPEAASNVVRRGLVGSGHETDRSLRIALGIAAVLVAVSRGDDAAAIAADARVIAGLARTPGAADALVRWSAVAGAEALLLAGRPEDALERLTPSRGGGGFAESRERVCLARIRLELGQLSAVPELIEPLLRPVVSYREPAVAAHLLQALVADRQHRESTAFAAVATAIDLAQPEDIRRPFLTTHARVGHLLERYQQLGGRHDLFAESLIGQLEPSRRRAPTPPDLIAPLTERELVVLQYLPTLLKAHEIGEDLNLSVNTIKAHLRSIYHKLGTSTRREAVERARAQRLI